MSYFEWVLSFIMETLRRELCCLNYSRGGNHNQELVITPTTTSLAVHMLPWVQGFHCNWILDPIFMRIQSIILHSCVDIGWLQHFDLVASPL